MPPSDKAEAQKIKEAQKAVHGEVKKLAKATKKQVDEAKALAAEKSDLAKVKKPGPDDKKRGKLLDLRIKAIEKTCKGEADATAKRIGDLLKTYVPDDKEALPMWQKGMDKWYVDMLKKEPGLDVGGGARVNGQISVKDKKALIDITWIK
ncbi:MAG: hypothetical protein ACI8R4_002807 [Paracoccaceae bacterium]|jgi:hypothetical protein